MLWYRIWHHRVISQTKTKWEGLQAFQNLMDTNYAALLTLFVFPNWNYNGGFFLYEQRHFLKVGLYSYSKWILAKTLTLMLPFRVPCVYWWRRNTLTLFPLPLKPQAWIGFVGKTRSTALTVRSTGRNSQAAPVRRPFVPHSFPKCQLKASMTWSQKLASERESFYSFGCTKKYSLHLLCRGLGRRYAPISFLKMSKQCFVTSSYDDIVAHSRIPQLWSSMPMCSCSHTTTCYF